VQTHLPWALHSWLAWQATHVPPPAPQAWFVDATHVPLEQQPVHVVPPQLHAPAVHACPVAQVPQALPPEPHAPVVWLAVGTHVVCWQQPLEHDVVVHSQVPALPHACPLPHAAQATPAVPHLSIAWFAYGTQMLFASQQPFAHEAAVHAHLPVASHVCPAPQAVQAPPGTPQLVSVGVTQAPAVVQHPVVHDPAHRQAPWVHSWPVAHAAQRAPPVPQELAVGAVMQRSFESQHPVGQFAALQTVAPSWASTPESEMSADASAIGRSVVGTSIATTSARPSAPPLPSLETSAVTSLLPSWIEPSFPDRPPAAASARPAPPAPAAPPEDAPSGAS